MPQEALNSLMARPEIAPMIGLAPGDPILTDDIYKCPDVYTVLSNEDYTAVTIWEEQSLGSYQGHTLFSNLVRGRDAIILGKEMIQWMLANKQPILLWGQTPIDNKAARWFNRQVGLKPFSYKTNHHWLVGPVEYFGYSPLFDAATHLGQHQSPN